MNSMSPQLAGVWMRDRCFASLLLTFVLSFPAFADGPADNAADKVRRIPKLGVDVPDMDRIELEQGLADLGKQIEKLEAVDNALVKSLLPDVLIYQRAVDQALRFREFFD